MFKFEEKVLPVNSEVLVHLKTIESPADERGGLWCDGHNMMGLLY